MHDPPSPLDHSTAFILAFGLAILCAGALDLSHRRKHCWFRPKDSEPCTGRTP